LIVDLASGIRQRGFRRWYERELLHCHVFLALTIACLIGSIGAFEAASQARESFNRWGNVAAIVICVGTGLWALRRYLYLLLYAETVAKQADCPGCGVYARFHLVTARDDGQGVLVRCKQCAHQWSIGP